MNPLIFQSDFGRADGAVSAMYGVAYCAVSYTHLDVYKRQMERAVVSQ